MLNKIHNWLINKIVGKKMVILNANFKNGITLDINEKKNGLVANCKFIGN